MTSVSENERDVLLIFDLLWCFLCTITMIGISNKVPAHFLLTQAQAHEYNAHFGTLSTWDKNTTVTTDMCN